jgi:3',5'-cyclic-AMP phosphodiesterase
METDKPFVLVQLSDPHVGAAWAAADPLTRFRGCVAAVRRSIAAADVAVVSGDLANHGGADEYALLQEELASLEIPVHVVPGNHDDRRTLRDCFGLPGEGDEPIDHVADVGPLRLVMLDSTIAGEDSGDLDRNQLDWLGARLGEAVERPTIIVMHHPPVRTGITAFDAIGLAESSRLELARILARSGQVLAVLSGHLHRPIAATIGGRAALTVPSTYLQSRLDLAATELVLAEDEPPAFAIHTLLRGCLTSHVQLVIQAEREVTFEGA